MNKLLPILVIVSIFLPFGCKFKNYQNCVSKKLIAYQDISGFDYIHFVENFEQYLIENGFLEDSTKQSWEKMIAEELYCQIDRTHLIGEIDDTFSNSPIVGLSSFCRQKEAKSVRLTQLRLKRKGLSLHPQNSPNAW
jgi:hypothetical protein